MEEKDTHVKMAECKKSSDWILRVEKKSLGEPGCGAQ